ncbi:MAG: VOC family protein [Thermodesulfobacteriota bacterium]
MRIERLDHLVLTVCDLEAAIVFYQRVMGMQPVTLADGRKALEFGESRINLHTRDTPARPKAKNPTPGSADLCFVSATPIRSVIEHLDRLGVPIEVGPVPREGALGNMTSVYFRDPDGNLIEVASYRG